MNALKDLIVKNRSCRKFDQSRKVTKDEFLRLVELARLSASAANRQTLRFALADGARAEAVFANISWAGYVKDGAPKLEQRPTAYILILSDKKEGKADLVTAGIAMQSILLGAAEMGLCGCIFGSIKREKLQESLNLSGDYEIINLIAIGKCAEDIRITDIKKGDSTKYWRDGGVHFVPKIITDDLIVNLD